MKNEFIELENKVIININYFTYTESDAVHFYNILIQYHSTHHLYIIKEGSRFYVRGLVSYSDFDLKYERYQLSLLANFYDCIKYNGNATYLVVDDATNDDNIF